MSENPNMEARSVRGVERILSKLEASVNQGNYYEAHQMYRTLYFRYLGQKKYETLLELLRSGSDVLLAHEQQTSGADLSILYVEVLSKAAIVPDEPKFVVLANMFSKMRPDLPERETFLREAMRWSTLGSENNKSGHPALHKLVAQTFWKEKNYPYARHHFLRSTDGQAFAMMLIEVHRVQGYPSEVDLFIAQAVLQYLCLQNKSAATVAFNSYTSQHPNIRRGPPYLLPLLNFIWFLLKAIESGKLPVFTVLCEQYEPSIQRDPAYPEYLDKIGQIFFGVPPPQPKSMGLFGNFFNSMGTIFNEESDSDELAGGSGTNAASTSQHRMETEDVD